MKVRLQKEKAFYAVERMKAKGKTMEIKQIENPEEKRRAAQSILEALQDWFGVEESRERYIRESAGQLFLAAWDDGQPVGFLCLKETGRATAEVAVMGVKQAYHRQGIGRMLMNGAKTLARQQGYHFLQVKTVQMGKYPDYDDTNRFYLSQGFEEFEVFPMLWDEQNPCQVYVTAL